jgi:hypothetical protein
MPKGVKKDAKPETDKLGQFEIGMDVIKERPDIVKRIMSECIVMRAEFIYGTNNVVYHVLHDDFEDRDLASPVPVYEPAYDDETDTLDWTKAE